MSKVGKILFASSNMGKLAEIREVASRFGVTILSPKELILDTPPPDVEENANTYLGNAKLKAEGFFAWSGLPSLSDDTGLEVKALNNEPGLFSARYAGEPADFRKNIEKLLSKLEGSSEREAKFVCSLYLKISANSYLSAYGEIVGEIAIAPRGKGGFGYDSVFVADGIGKTLAELKENRLTVKTHRVAAAEKLFELLK